MSPETVISLTFACCADAVSIGLARFARRHHINRAEAQVLGSFLQPPGPERVLASLIIDHVLLAMPPGKETEARAFFVGILGMVEEEKPTRLQSRGGCWFRWGSCKVHVGGDEDFQPQRKAHPAFVVDEIDVLSDRLTQSGHDVVWDNAIPGSRRFFTADPFGNRIEFLQNPID